MALKWARSYLKEIYQEYNSKKIKTGGDLKLNCICIFIYLNIN
jgi:hypothetical protein